MKFAPDVPPLKLEFDDVANEAGSFRSGRRVYVIEEGCNCVLLGTREINDKGDVTYYGSTGSIDHNGTYETLVRAGHLSDLRSFLPLWNHRPGRDSTVEWRAWLAACAAGMAAFNAAMNGEPHAAE